MRQAFASHGVESSEESGWLVFSPQGISANGALFAEPSQANPAGLQLDVRVLIMPEYLMIVESFAGVGYTPEEALRYAYTGFVQNTLHVLLAALFGRGEEQVSRGRWVVGGLPRIATIGDVTIRTIRTHEEAPAGPEAVAWLGELKRGIKAAWLRDLEREIKAADLSPGTHWIRVFYAQLSRRMQACEVLLDNEPWEPVQDHIAHAPWPTSDEFYSMRLVLILQDKQGAGPR